MAIERKPFQGVFNIVRFNWHFYIVAGLVLGTIIFLKSNVPETLQNLVSILLLLLVFTIVVSLGVSYYIYDFSSLYKLNWLPNLDNKKVLNINAGFDETTTLVKEKFKKSKISVCDFYDAKKHTEVSIKRARMAYPPVEGTVTVKTDKLPFEDNSFQYTLAILSAHEIRDENERIGFFKELNRVTASDGKIIVTEHLRDTYNFLAYTIGFLHFHSKATWNKTFVDSGFKVKSEIKTTPFITTFILEKNGNSY